MLRYVLKIGYSNFYFHDWLPKYIFLNADFLKYMTFFFFLLVAYIFDYIGKICAFSHNWLHKHMLALRKIGKIHIFFTVDFLKCSIFVLIGCINAHLCRRAFFFFSTDFFEIALVNTQLFCRKSSNFALLLLLVVEKWNFFSVDFF